MRLKQPIIAIAAVSAFTLAACGGDGSGSGTGSGNDDQPDTSEGGNTGQTQDPDREGPVTIDGATEGGTVTVISTSGLNTMDPTEAYYQNTTSILTGLVTRAWTQYAYDEENNTMVLVPDLATDLGRPNDDFTEWTFTLRDGITYEDGTPVEPEDFVFSAARSFDREAFPEGPAFSNDYFLGGDTYKGPYTGNGLKGFEAVTVDGMDVTYKMATPFPDMLYWASFAAMGPIQEGAASDPEKYRLKPLATGPYKFGKYVPEKSLELVRNPEWDPATDPARTAYPDKYEFDLQVEEAQLNQILLEDSAEDQATLTYDDVLAVNFDQFKADGRAAVGSFPLTSFWAPDYTKITDIKIRQALAYAYPYEDADLAGGYIEGVTSLPGAQLLPPGTAGRKDFNPLPDHEPGSTDTDAAMALLEEADAVGYEVKFLYTKDSDSGVKVKDAIVASLTKAGFSPKPVPTTIADFSTLRADPDTDINVRSGGWIADWPSGGSWFPPLLKSTDVEAGILGANYSKFNEPDMDAEMKRIQTLPVDEQADAWGELDDTIMTDYFPLFVTRYGGVAQAYGSAIEGHFIDNTIGMPTWKNIWVNS
ncbi:ABC transporter substrate-binding protein [Nocardioides sp.]|uniref:ABC transporter substrate-binding protein n=1 Tax=Nocardioides sp. TaxID=35761 RepID=UPI00239533E9|nr:ABC transporter substrate-binding protein [Nocardioides sp.]MDE0776339.1 ABC transporter substrate-binding protein [Nocardioides sp.]